MSADIQKISRRALRFGRSTKGMLLLIFAAIAVLAAFPVGGMTVVSRVATAAVSPQPLTWRSLMRAGAA
jgi:hypothetical protein